MIKRPTGKCKFSGCKNHAVYGGNNFVPVHCETHKLTDELNLVERACNSCGLTMILDKTNLCEYCNPESFKKATLAKQTAIMDYLDNRKDLPVPLSTDKIIDGGACTKKRPDRIYEFDDKIIVIECDENQHRERACECEQARMVDIGQAFGGLPVYFIRWNPDIYQPDNEKKAIEPIEKRNKLLGDLIRDIVKSRIELPITLVSAIYLYYDGWDGLHNEEWKIITSFES